MKNLKSKLILPLALVGGLAMLAQTGCATRDPAFAKAAYPSLHTIQPGEAGFGGNTKNHIISDAEAKQMMNNPKYGRLAAWEIVDSEGQHVGYHMEGPRGPFSWQVATDRAFLTDSAFDGPALPDGYGANPLNSFAESSDRQNK